jgi:hypothetical protein
MIRGLSQALRQALGAEMFVPRAGPVETVTSVQLTHVGGSLKDRKVVDGIEYFELGVARRGQSRHTE